MVAAESIYISIPSAESAATSVSHVSVDAELGYPNLEICFGSCVR